MKPLDYNDVYVDSDNYIPMSLEDYHKLSAKYAEDDFKDMRLFLDNSPVHALLDRLEDEGGDIDDYFDGFELCEQLKIEEDAWNMYQMKLHNKENNNDNNSDRSPMYGSDEEIPF